MKWIRLPQQRPWLDVLAKNRLFVLWAFAVMAIPITLVVGFVSGSPGSVVGVLIVTGIWLGLTIALVWYLLLPVSPPSVAGAAASFRDTEQGDRALSALAGARPRAYAHSVTTGRVMATWEDRLTVVALACLVAAAILVVLAVFLDGAALVAAGFAFLTFAVAMRVVGAFGRSR